MALTLYLDTSVLSALRDTRTPERQALTLQFWTRRGEFDLISSTVLATELEAVPDPIRRKELLDDARSLLILPITEDLRGLATRYVSLGVFGVADINDALHVAAAVLSAADILVSWNFRHLVNRRRRGLINSINMQLGHPAIEILSPPEV